MYENFWNINFAHYLCFILGSLVDFIQFVFFIQFDNNIFWEGEAGVLSITKITKKIILNNFFLPR